MFALDSIAFAQDKLSDNDDILRVSSHVLAHICIDSLVCTYIFSLHSGAIEA